jgi:signal transduction histidine kinase
MNSGFDAYQAQILISCVGVFVLAVITVLKDRDSRLNLSAAFFYLLVSFWQLDLFLIRGARTVEEADMVSRFIRPAILMLPVSMLIFVRLLTKYSIKMINAERGLLALALTAGVMNLAGVGFKGMVLKGKLGYVAQPDIIYVIFILILVSSMAMSCYLLVKKYFSADVLAHEKKQVQYLLFGTAVGFLGGITNILNIYGFDVFPMAGFGVLIFFSLITYSIFTYNLLNIRELLQKTLIYVFNAAIVVAIYFMINEMIFVRINSYLYRGLAFFAITLLITLGMDPTLKMLDRVTKKAFFISHYDYQVLLQHFLLKIRFVKEYEALFSSVTGDIVNVLKLRSSVIFFWDADKRCFILYSDEKHDEVCLPERHPLIRYFRSKKEIVYYKKIEDDIAYNFTMKDEYRNLDINEMLALLKKYDAEVCVPLSVNGELKGVWILGGKINKSTFRRDEMQWMENIASQTSVVIENILLYEQLLHSERLAMLGKMSATVAHEIRNPITGLNGFVQMARADRSNTAALDKFLEIAPDEFKRLEKLTNNLLALSHTAAIKLEKTDLVKMLDNVIEFMKHTFRDRRIVIARNMGGVPEIKVDSEQIRQVLLNIVMNAVQAMPDGGEIEFSAGTRVKYGKKYVYISVRDHGSGIDELNMEKIYEPFFTTKADGTGLGLAISKNMLGAHNGFIDAENAPDGGCVFTVNFPV